MAPSDGRPPRRTKLEDVAARVGLSPASVSLVLRNAPGPSAATRERVLRAAAELGYRPDRTASLLARRRTRLLGVMIDVHNSFHAELVEALDGAAEQMGYDLVLSTVTRTRDEGRAVETLLDFRCEALLLLGTTIPEPRLATLVGQLPVVVVGRRLGREGPDVVRAADDAGVALAVHHLVGLGHRRIAFVDGGRGTIAADRRRGYRLAMRRHGLGDEVRVLPGEHTEEGGIRVARALLAAEAGDGLPTALVTSNDRIALGVLDVLKTEGVDVPGRVSVVGYDDSPAARLSHIALTSVSQDPERMAAEAVEAAVERLDQGRTRPRQTLLSPHLVVRGTTAPPPA